MANMQLTSLVLVLQLLLGGCYFSEVEEFRDITLPGNASVEEKSQFAARIIESAMASGLRDNVRQTFPDAPEKQLDQLEVQWIVRNARTVSIRCSITLPTDEALDTSQTILAHCTKLLRAEIERELNKLETVAAPLSNSPTGELC